LPFACVLECDVEFALHILMHAAGHANTAGLGEPFQPRRHVDAVAEDVFFINDDVADVNADAKLDTAIFGNYSITLSHGTLDFHGATGCVDRTGKLDQSTVAAHAIKA
jgi:hypothetical protein